MKKLFTGLLAVMILLSSLSISASATVIYDHSLTNEELQNTEDVYVPLVYTPCTGGNGICQMYSQGWAQAYHYETGEYLEEYGLTCAWQCRNCHSVMLTAGDPKLGIPIGNYVVVACDYDLSIQAMHFVNIDPDDIQYCSKVYLSGYKFHNSSLL